MCTCTRQQLWHISRKPFLCEDSIPNRALQRTLYNQKPTEQHKHLAPSQGSILLLPICEKMQSCKLSICHGSTGLLVRGCRTPACIVAQNQPIIPAKPLPVSQFSPSLPSLARHLFLDRGPQPTHSAILQHTTQALCQLLYMHAAKSVPRQNQQTESVTTCLCGLGLGAV